MLLHFHCIILSLCLTLSACCASAAAAAFITANGRSITKKSPTPSIITSQQNNNDTPHIYSRSTVWSSAITTLWSSAIKNSDETKIIDYENTITEDDNPLTSAGLSFISASDKSLGMLFCK